MYRAARRDANEPEIIRAAQLLGASVVQLDAAGIPDLLIGYRGHNYLIEVKAENGKLTVAQLQFFKSWSGQAQVIRSIQELNALLTSDSDYGKITAYTKAHIY